MAAAYPTSPAAIALHLKQSDAALHPGILAAVLAGRVDCGWWGCRRPCGWVGSGCTALEVACHCRGGEPGTAGFVVVEPVAWRARKVFDAGLSQHIRDNIAHGLG